MDVAGLLGQVHLHLKGTINTVFDNLTQDALSSNNMFSIPFSHNHNAQKTI